MGREGRRGLSSPLWRPTPPWPPTVPLPTLSVPSCSCPPRDFQQPRRPAAIISPHCSRVPHPPSAMSAPPPSSTSTAGFFGLPDAVLTNGLAPLLVTADLLAVATTSRGMRRLFLSPPLWRCKVFSSLPPLPASSLSSLPSWCDAVQLVDARGFSQVSYGTEMPADWPWSLSSLTLLPNLRQLSTHHEVLTRRSGHLPSSAFAAASLASLRHPSRSTRVGS